MQERDLYQEKLKILTEYQEFNSYEFYRFLFPEGSFQNVVGKGNELPSDNIGNGFLVYENSKGKKNTRIVFDDLKEIEKYKNRALVFMSSISYFGKNRTLSNSRFLYALVFDLDEVTEENLNLFFTWRLYRKVTPEPTFIVNSGNGVHVYYVFDNPIPLYPNNRSQLKKLKYSLTKKIWNGDTSSLEKIQYQGINQGFRVVGSKSKKGHIVRAFKVGDRVSIDYLNKFVNDDEDKFTGFYKSKMSFDEAKKKYPNWEPGMKKAWTCKRDLYDWWLRKKHQVEYHHRYYYIMSLTIYAVKCGIEFEELKDDAYSLVDFLNNINPEEPFTNDDVKSALEMYSKDYATFPRDEISKITAIDIKKNKRNFRSQEQHLKIARATRDILQEEKGTTWNGRKSYREEVFQFLDMYPNASYKDFIELTGMKKDVFYKYKKLKMES